MSSQPPAMLYTQGFGSYPENVEIPVVSTASPGTNNINYPIGKRWINTSANAEYVLTSKTTSAGVTTGAWQITASPTGAIATLTGDSGTATPAAGNIQIAGTASQISTIGAGAVITISLPAAIIAPGSLVTTTSLAATTTITAGTGLTVTAGGAAVTGTTTINTTGAAVTTIGTGGTGAVNIGNATGNTAVTGSLTASTGLVATTGGIAATGTSTINTSGAAVTTIGTGGTGAVNIGNATGNTAVTGSLTASTSLTASAGDITATLGNVIINGAAKQLIVHGGAATDFIGQATLTNGTVTVLNTNIAATDRVLVTRSAKNGSTNYGTFLTTINAATSFVITSCKSDTTTETNDASTVDYFIVRQV